MLTLRKRKSCRQPTFFNSYMHQYKKKGHIAKFCKENESGETNVIGVNGINTQLTTENIEAIENLE